MIGGGGVFLSGGGISPGSLLYSTIGPSGTGTFLSAILSDNGAAANYNFAVGHAANPGDPSRDDHVLTIGYNTKTLGGRDNLSEPAFEWRIEDYYHPGSGPFVEAHWQYYDATGAGYRPIATQINRTNGGYLTDATMSLKATALSYLGINNTQYVKFIAGGVHLLNTTYLDNYVNNIPWLRQMNAAGDTLITLAYLDSSNVVNLGIASSVNLGSSVGGINVPSFMSVGNTTLVSTHKLYVRGAAVSAMLAATAATLNFEAGQNVDGSGTILELGPNALPWGGRIYAGRWTSGDRGVRLTGQNSSTGAENAYIHLNAEGQTVLLSVAGGTNNLFLSTVGVGIQQAVPTAALHLPASTTARASLCIPVGVAPTSPVSGDIWVEGTDLKLRIGSTTYTITKLQE